MTHSAFHLTLCGLTHVLLMLYLLGEPPPSKDLIMVSELIVSLSDHLKVQYMITVSKVFLARISSKYVPLRRIVVRKWVLVIGNAYVGGGVYQCGRDSPSRERLLVIQVNLSPTNGRNEKIKHCIRIKIYTPIILRF